MSLLYWLLGLGDPGSIRSAVEWGLYSARPVPTALLAVVAAVGLAAAGLNILPHAVMTWRTRLALAALRLTGFAVLAALLVRGELRLTVDRELPARLAVLTDTSGSMGLKDVGGATRLEAARAFAAGPLAPLADRAQVSRYAFGWRLDADDGGTGVSPVVPVPPGNKADPMGETPMGHTGKMPVPPSGLTRLAEALQEAARREVDLQAIVLLSDGKDTAGDRGTLVAPLLRRCGVPVYPVVFGQAQAPRMGEVRLTGGGTYVRLGDELKLSATLSAQNLPEQTVRAALYEKGAARPLAVRQDIRLGAEPVAVSFVVTPAKPGRKAYRIVMEGLRGAATDSRLAAEQQVDVVDAKVRVLYLDIPRDERKVLGHWLARDPVVDLAELTLMPKGGWYGQGALRHANQGEGLPSKESDLYQYDVVILGDIPRACFRPGGDVAETRMRWLAEFVARRGGGLITLGGQQVYAAGGYQDSILARILPFEIAATAAPQIDKPFALAPTVMGLAHPVMQLEADPAANREAWGELPTLDGCNRVGAAKPGSTLLAVRPAFAKATAGLPAAPGGDGGQPTPVLAILDVGKGKVLASAADTTWRWEMMRDAQAPDRFRRFWGNAVRYLAPDPRLEPGRPQIQRSREHPAVGQTVTLTTRLVDAVYQPVRGADLTVEVTSPSGRTYAIYPRDGRATPGVYAYDLALDEPGAWSAKATYKDRTAEEVVQAGESDEELDDPRACPDRMEELAKATGGAMYRPDQAGELLAKLSLKARRVRQTYAVALWNLPLALVIFAALVCADCAIRKRRGMP